MTTMIGAGQTNTVQGSLQTFTTDDLITAPMVRIAVPNIDNAYVNEILPYLNHYAHAYSINTNLRIAHFMAQIGHESGFRPTEEKVSYTAPRMRAVFGCAGNSNGYDTHTDDCRVGVHKIRPLLWTNESYYAGRANSEHLLNYVYANRNGNGSEASGDGYKYRGRGLIQLTGKSNYQSYTNIHNSNNSDDHQDFVVNPALLITNVKYAIESGFVYWTMRHINNACTGSTDPIIDHISYLVNGGTIGLAERRTIFHNLMQYMGGH